MKTINRYKTLFIIFLIVITFHEALPQSSPLNGDWVLIPEKSAEISLYRTLSISLQVHEQNATITRRWGGSRYYEDTIELYLNGKQHDIPIDDRVFPTNVFMGLSLPVGNTRKVSAVLSDNNQTLKVTETYSITGSQGSAPLSAVHVFTLTDHGVILKYTVNRSTRPTDYPITYVLKKKGTRNAWYMNLPDSWNISGNLDQQAFMITLQGIANKNGPQLYFVYPEKWDFRFTPEVKDFLVSDHFYTFRELKTAAQALQRFKQSVDGYIVWDKNVRTSLIVAFTVAGLENSVVVSEDMIPLVESAGLKKVIDFRNKFTGMTDAQIYSWAFDQYWSRCNHELTVWMGGEAGSTMKPGVADWGIYNKAFFQDLSTKPSDKEEYALAKKILSDMKPMSLIFGWHSYAKDKERDHVTLTSSFGHRVEGLHTLPNMSFSSQVKATPGFTFKNNHRIVSGKTYKPKNKVYIACVQTDCLGLGAWTRPGRGSIPYAWEVTMNWSWLAPAMMEFFYTQSTPNDYFIGSLSGPGYMYPKAIPDKLLPGLIQEAGKLMKDLDLNVFEIMDYSEGATVEGNTELTEKVVNAYYDGLPNAIGFINGYAPSFTFTSRKGRPLISYDYYLSPERPEAAAAGDLAELARINGKRPYFLLMHVRQWSDISRVKNILDRLGPEFELVPLDVFLKMAGTNPTFKERFLEK